MRVYVCDDSPEHRALVRAVLADDRDVEIVGEACDGEQCLSDLAEARPDVLLLDLRMPRVDGFAALEALRGRPDAPRVLVLTSSSADEVEDRIRAAGATYLRKGASPDELRRAVRALAA